MISQSKVRILESDSNKLGDLFGRLMEALFLALGYDRSRLNIHKSGREIDIEAQHRTEPRRVVAECKATTAPVGGGDINKFVGSLDAERRKQDDVDTEGYFISISGFTETAIEQEKELGEQRLILLNSDRVVEELCSGRIIVPEGRALELSGRCVPPPLSGLSVSTQTELLAHEIGWIWAVYFRQKQEITHFALVHADGNFISSTLADAVIFSDRAVGGKLYLLQYLAPPADPANDVDTAQAQEKYHSYLAHECGEIQLEGLPADQEVGSRRLSLEHLFVPLHLLKSLPPLQEPPANAREDPGVAASNRPSTARALTRRKRATGKTAKAGAQKEPERTQIGDVLNQYSRIAILGLPGGGKSTLLKRLATAYAFPERRHLVDDKLPQRDWLPLFVRCRQLGPLVRSPVTTILQGIGARSEMPPELLQPFNALVSRKLRDGAALLLVDGLDEISDEADRVCFVGQLRTFLATYPGVALAVTSREAGFRVIGGALSSHCEHFKLADFDEDDIKHLTLNWHKEVVGDTLQNRADAEKLAETICANYRLQNLASNPLLLTTLLLVRRWIGQLPTRRTVLYGKAIEVLLMTWNVEGHQPLDPDEIIPQLEYLATVMMQAGIQTISSKKLTEALTTARLEMPEILGYARISVSEFIRRVELRSSLLMLSGHVVEDGVVYPMYEFRHLTFQEYLVAGAMVNGHYPGRTEKDDLLGLLTPHLEDARWSEIVPLAAVLAGRKVQPLIASLIQLCKMQSPDSPWAGHAFDDEPKRPSSLLAACLADEIQASPDLLKEAIRLVVHLDSIDGLTTIGSAKYGTMLFEEVMRELQTTQRDVMRIEGNLLRMFPQQLEWDREWTSADLMFERIDLNLGSSDPIEQVRGCLSVMELAYMTASTSKHATTQLWNRPISVDTGHLRAWRDRILPLRNSERLYLRCAALWALVWIGQVVPWSPQEITDILPELIVVWRTSGSLDLQYLASWMISEMPLLHRGKLKLGGAVPGAAAFLEQKRTAPQHRYEFPAAIMSGYFLGSPWSDNELAGFLGQQPKSPMPDDWRRGLLILLGHDPGDGHKVESAQVKS